MVQRSATIMAHSVAPTPSGARAMLLVPTIHAHTVLHAMATHSTRLHAHPEYWCHAHPQPALRRGPAEARLRGPCWKALPAGHVPACTTPEEALAGGHLQKGPAGRPSERKGRLWESPVDPAPPRWRPCAGGPLCYCAREHPGLCYPASS